MKKIVKLLVLLVTVSPILIAGTVAYNNMNISMLSLILILCLGAGLSFALMKIYEQASDIYDYEHNEDYLSKKINEIGIVNTSAINILDKKNTINSILSNINEKLERNI